MITEFRKLNEEQFKSRYKAALDELTDPECEFDADEYELAEVKIPGHGWHACIVVESTPWMFWCHDDGWQIVPIVEFKEFQAL